MMPDMGKYAAEVYGAYAITFALLGGLIWLSLAQARRARRALEDAEAARKNG